MQDYPHVEVEEFENASECSHKSQNKQKEQNVKLITKVCEKIMKTEKEIEHNIRKSAKQRKDFVDALSKELEKESQEQETIIDMMCAQFKEQNKSKKSKKIQRLKDLCNNIEKEQEQFKTKKIEDLQKEMNSILKYFQTESPPSPPNGGTTRHSLPPKINSSRRSTMNLEKGRMSKLPEQVNPFSASVCFKTNEDSTQLDLDQLKSKSARGERTNPLPPKSRAFNSQLEKLQTDLAQNLNKMKQSFVSVEMKQQADRDLGSLDSLNYSGAEKLAQIFKSTPQLTSNDGKISQALETWQTLKPITLFQIIKNTGLDGNLNNQDSEFVEHDGDEYQTKGLFKKDSENEEGIARVIYKEAQEIKEGHFECGKLNGYGRVFYNNTYAYYVGNFQDDLFHGKGKLVYLDGKIQQGSFDNDKFIGS